MGHVLCWVEKTCLKAVNGKVQWWSLRVQCWSFDNEVQGFDSEVQQQSLEVFPHYWWSSTVRAHYSQSSTAFWCQWQTLVKFAHHFWSLKVIFEVHQSLVKFYKAHMCFVEVSKFIKVHQHFHTSLKFDTKFNSFQSCNIHPGLVLQPQTKIYKHI